MTVSVTVSAGARRAPRARRFSAVQLQRGASLLEGVAYLGIAAIVILGAISLLTSAFSSAQSNRASQELVSIRTAVRKLYMGQGYGTASLNVPLIAAKAFPGNLAVSGAVVTNAWGGTVTVTGDTNQFTTVYTNVPKDACINTVSGASGWINITGPGTTVDTFPAAVAAANALCTGDVNSLTFRSN